jgi:hypothetical protein
VESNAGGLGDVVVIATYALIAGLVAAIFLDEQPLIISDSGYHMLVLFNSDQSF